MVCLTTAARKRRGIATHPAQPREKRWWAQTATDTSRLIQSLPSDSSLSYDSSLLSSAPSVMPLERHAPASARTSTSRRVRTRLTACENVGGTACASASPTPNGTGTPMLVQVLVLLLKPMLLLLRMRLPLLPLHIAGAEPLRPPTGTSAAAPNGGPPKRASPGGQGALAQCTRTQGCLWPGDAKPCRRLGVRLADI